MIPPDLIALPQWVAWQWRTAHGRRTKVPINAVTGAYASSTDPSTWATFAVAVAKQADGIGFVVTADDPYCGVDIDHCLGENGLDPQAKSVVDRLNSYSEITPSGTGIRIWVKAKLTRPGNKRHLVNHVVIEMYDRGRYFTVTGRSGKTTPSDIFERQAEIDALHLELFPDRPIQAGPFHGNGLEVSDLDLLGRARAAANGNHFDQLWLGDSSCYGGDASSADLALLCHLAFWTGRNAGQMDRLFRQSGLYRDKWEREDYRLRSLAKAIELTDDTWTPENHGTLFVGSPADTTLTESRMDGEIRISDLSAEIEQYYDDGLKPGEDPGWPSVAELYRVSRGEWTVITGMSGSGKTEWLDALIVNLVELHGWKFAICSPEKQPLKFHFGELAKKVIGKPWSGTERMSRDEMLFAKDFLDQYVTFVLPETPTIDAVLSVVSRTLARVGLDGVVIDPWNELEHSRPRELSETEYISLCLSKLRRFARQHRIHLWLVAHPTKLQKEAIYGDDKKPLIKNGRRVTQYPVPDLYSISGSAKWRDKADNGIAVHRNPEGDINAVEIHVQKIRFLQNGKLGTAFLNWDPVTGRFHDSGIILQTGCLTVGSSPSSIERESALVVPQPPSFYDDDPTDRGVSGALSPELEAELIAMREADRQNDRGTGR